MKVVGLGAGGHAKVVLDALRASGVWQVVGLLDADPQLQGAVLAGVPVLGDDNLLPELYRQGVRHVFIGVGSVGSTAIRRCLYQQAAALGFAFVRVIHPQAVVAESAILGDGPTVLAGAVINAEARLGENALINTRAVVEHDCVIGPHVHIATGAVLGGGVQVGEGAHVGLSAGVRQGIRIGRNAVVGAGAMVVRDVPDEVVVVGVPARVLKKVEEP